MTGAREPGSGRVALWRFRLLALLLLVVLVVATVLVVKLVRGEFASVPTAPTDLPRSSAPLLTR